MAAGSEQDLPEVTDTLGRQVRFVDGLTRFPLATLGLIAVMAAMHFWAQTRGGASEDSLVLLLLVSGAKVNASVLNGEWWRLIASAFLHGTFIHLVVNAVGVLLLGWFIENAMGRSFVLVCYVLSAVAGGLVSVHTTDYPSVGASGGMFGLLGATVSYAVLRWRQIPSLVRSYVIGLPLAVGAASLFHGFVASNVDNAAHAGGALSGVLVGITGVVCLGRCPAGVRFLGRLILVASVLATIYSLGATAARMTFRFDVEPVEWAIRGEGERRVHLWPASWRGGTLVEGVCLLGEPVTGEAVRCYSDPYYSTLIVGPLARMRGTGIYAEWRRRTSDDEEIGGLYDPYDILWHEDAGRDLAFALLAYSPIADKYVPAFTAFCAQPTLVRGGPGGPAGGRRP